MLTAKLITEITELTMKLKSTHPDVYDHLDENPITLKIVNGQCACDSELQDYLQTLKDLLDEHGS
ncbi:MAG: hypothetical protein KBF73_04135 [Flavobacteriales bacterium]|nr:hypothetical protein [Flavobacteriales bacterium]